MLIFGNDVAGSEQVGGVGRLVHHDGETVVLVGDINGNVDGADQLTVRICQRHGRIDRVDPHTLCGYRTPENN